MIAIVDYGAGNPGSIANMLKRVGAPCIISSEPNEISKASKIILPGVGAFDAAMQALNNSGLKELLEEKALIEKVPVLGICLGMQLLTNGSEEGKMKGLGWIPAATYKFNATEDLKVPHMGWNGVKVIAQNPLLAGLTADSRFYFVHSYYVKTERPEHSISQTTYGFVFASAIASNNIMGVQFHPEKSHTYGMKLLANFAAL